MANESEKRDVSWAVKGCIAVNRDRPFTVKSVAELCALTGLGLKRDDKKLHQQIQEEIDRLVEAGKVAFDGWHYWNTEQRDTQFCLSNDEWNAVYAWQKEHLKLKHNCKTAEEKSTIDGAIGNIFSFVFTPSYLGTFAVCKCNICAEEIQIHGYF